MAGVHDHPVTASERHRGRLIAAFGLTGSLFVAELVVGLIAHSLAVVADAGHLAADIVTLGAALAATRIATRSDISGQRTYGRYRAEVFAAGFAVLVMLAVGGVVIGGAVSRVGHEPHIATGPMLWIGIAGLAVNIVAVLLLRSGAAESLNLKGAYLEVLGDAAGSVGVIAASLLIAGTRWPAWDVVVAIAIGAFVMARAIGLGRSVLRVLGQHAPQGIDPHRLAADLEAIDGVADVHDVHLWELTSGMTVATAHLVATDTADHHTVLDAARDLLAHTYDIEHATLQIEPRDHTSCRHLNW
ncbi:MAG: cation transporter [Actinobacteria bacterium 69-20]|nr:MAG: cation transporter [Actinobacteria bacterium 69-20]